MLDDDHETTEHRVTKHDPLTSILSQSLSVCPRSLCFVTQSALSFFMYMDKAKLHPIPDDLVMYDCSVLMIAGLA